MSIRWSLAALGMAGMTLGLVDPVEAADLGPYRQRGAPPLYDERPPPMAYAPWSGFYIGATLGYATGTVGIDGGSGAFSFDQSGGIGTVMAGYSWQSGGMVVGLEGDLGTGNLDGSAVSAGSTLRSELNVLGSLRARAGVLMSPQALLYVTGGFAWADYDFKVSGFNTVSQTLAGYQLGAGLEFAIAPQWTLRAEYLYTDLAAQSVDHGGGLVNRYDPDTHTFRAGVAVKF